MAFKNDLTLLKVTFIETDGMEILSSDAQYYIRENNNTLENIQPFRKHIKHIVLNKNDSTKHKPQ